MTAGPFSDDAASMRLDKFLVACGAFSRRDAQRAVRRGRVCVDGEPLRDPASKVHPTQQITADGERVALRGPRYLLLHKPPGYVCATRDDRYPTVLELMPQAEREGLHIAGRLDVDTTGLVLLTDDGAWSHRVTSPRHRCDKRYRVTLADPVSDTDVARLRDGILLRGEAQPTRPAGVEVADERTVLLTLQEGRYHQVKRMFGALGNRVIALHRDRVGSVVLDPDMLPQGAFRFLSPAEVAALG